MRMGSLKVFISTTVLKHEAEKSSYTLHSVCNDNRTIKLTFTLRHGSGAENTPSIWTISYQPTWLTLFPNHPIMIIHANCCHSKIANAYYFNMFTALYPRIIPQIIILKEIDCVTELVTTLLLVRNMTSQF